MKSIHDNLAVINENIERACQKVHRDSKEIKLIAVTKYTTIERAQEALDAGIVNLGENRDQEFLSKYEVLGDQAVWHYIGSLQTRKVKNIIDKVTYIHSLDRISLAEEINKRSERTIPCFVQVNVSNEPTKHGISREETLSFIKELAQYPSINVIGLMTMAPNTDNEEIIRNCFRSLKSLQQEIQNQHFTHAPCKELSMGMSNDYEIAIEEGATFIRIGTALVG